MTDDDRVQQLLARQAIAAVHAREKEREEGQRAAAAVARRTQAEDLWACKCKDVDVAIERLNELMTPNGVRLYRRWTDKSGVAGELDRVEIGFTPSREPAAHIQFVMFHVHADGNVLVRMGTKNHLPAKEDKFSLEQADEALACLADRFRRHQHSWSGPS